MTLEAGFVLRRVKSLLGLGKAVEHFGQDSGNPESLAPEAGDALVGVKTFKDEPLFFRLLVRLENDPKGGHFQVGLVALPEDVAQLLHKGLNLVRRRHFRCCCRRRCPLEEVCVKTVEIFGPLTFFYSQFCRER